MTSKALRVVIAGGGTGGHLYPGIAVAKEFLSRRPEATVTFAGTARGIEARVIPKEGFGLDLIRSSGLKGKSAIDRARGSFGLRRASLPPNRARAILRRANTRACAARRAYGHAGVVHRARTRVVRERARRPSTRV